MGGACTSTVLHLIEGTASWVDFSTSDGDASIPDLSLPAATWRDMGMPETVTVTVRSGDRLTNDADDEAR